MSETDQDVIVRGREAQRRSRRCKRLQEDRRRASDDGEDYETGSQETATSGAGPEIDWEALALGIYGNRMSQMDVDDSGKGAVADSSVDSATGDADVNRPGNDNRTADATGPSMDVGADESRIAGGQSGSGSSGGEYVNSFKPINARAV
ncbi:hypothetical protein LX36DRAFT_665016 [Colletotrichum falcatum]|nr:hypothetical protein LX36DRAFT_665016 [Colletotrichum falcatum]